MSSACTLIYRQMRALDNLKPGQYPKLDVSVLEATPIGQ